MITLRPGITPDTPPHHEAGETWRWFADIDRAGDSPLERMTAAYLYRYENHPSIDDGWWGSCGLCGLVMEPRGTREEQEAQVEAHLRDAHDADIVNDPRRTT